ncbi:winged helix-turn-helix transcriptional regulator [Natronococcus wangiae]|uniref:winged helix-turn-helix transcriptional regulator n=1 Tax=Natronococcus wangiae TaxID=3068275 RepID=UPI00273FF9A8|nr:winged helix-turn-helix transcriptional regulator [Natronococcus sp. AD5]
MPIDEPLPGQAEREILRTLAESGPITIPELADRLAAHPVTIERRCRELQRAGYVRRCTGGTFTVDRTRRNGRVAGD